MTRIGGIGSGATPARRASRSAGGFALPGRADAREATGIAGAAGVASLLGLQEGAAAPAALAEHAQRRGEAVLDDLRGLQLDLLRGADDPARLERLARDAVPPAGIADPALRAVLAGIALRARVELARRRVAIASSV